MTTPKALLAILGATALLTAGLVPVAGASAAPGIDWAPCGPVAEGFDCATVAVPTDYDRPGGATTSIALTRLPASGPAGQRLGSLFVNPGGPGGSGVDFVQSAASIAFQPEVRARYDIVGFDPRGVARSDPATCFRTAEQEASSPLLADIYPITAAQERRYTVESAEVAARCQLTSPRRFATASTANVARDLDRLRAAAGDRKLNYVGYSYGTYLGATYAKLFPARVGRFVLDGTVDPIAWSGTGTGDAAPSVPLGARIRQGPGADETFGEFTRLCAAAGPETCPLAALGDPEKVAYATFDRLATDPVDLELPDGTSLEITQQIAVAETFSSLYAPSTWADLAAFLAFLAQPPAAAEDLTAAAARLYGPVGTRARGEDYPSFGGALASLCVDTAKSRRVGAYPAIADRQDAKAPYFGRYRLWVTLPCEFWALRDAGAYTGPWRQTTRSTVLVFGTRFDPATPYRQTAPYAALWPDARMVTVEGYGHTTLGKSTCADDLITGYLVGGSAPASGATCNQDVAPFSSGPSAAARSAGIPRFRDVPPGLPFW